MNRKRLIYTFTLRSWKTSSAMSVPIAFLDLLRTYSVKKRWCHALKNFESSRQIGRAQPIVYFLFPLFCHSLSRSISQEHRRRRHRTPDAPQNLALVENRRCPQQTVTHDQLQVVHTLSSAFDHVPTSRVSYERTHRCHLSGSRGTLDISLYFLVFRASFFSFWLENLMTML